MPPKWWYEAYFEAVLEPHSKFHVMMSFMFRIFLPKSCGIFKSFYQLDDLWTPQAKFIKVNVVFGSLPLYVIILEDLGIPSSNGYPMENPTDTVQKCAEYFWMSLDINTISLIFLDYFLIFPIIRWVPANQRQSLSKSQADNVWSHPQSQVRTPFAACRWEFGPDGSIHVCWRVLRERREH